MTVAMQHISLTKIRHLTLAQCIVAKVKSNNDAWSFQIFNDALHIDSQLLVAEQLTLSSKINLELSTIDEEFTLVVFDNITFDTLYALLQECSLTINQLNKVNVRNSKTSFRFSVSTNNLALSRAALVSFSLSNQIEAALISNVPTLDEPGILVMDMDSTTIKIECIDEIAILAGVGKQVAEVTELAMQGKLDFAQSLHQRVATLANAPESILEEVVQNIPLMEGLETLILSLKQYHWRIAIASGGFTYFADHLKERLNLDNTFANDLEIVNRKLTGRVLGDVVDAQAKADSLQILSEQYQIDASQTVAMGDGANDLVMMKAACLGVAFHAKEIVLKQADTCINFSGLDCVLHWLE